MLVPMQDHGFLEPRAIAPDQIRPLRVEEYMQLVEAGVFDDEKVELLDGVVVKMSAQGPKHLELVTFLTRLLARRLPDDYAVVPQCTHRLSEYSAPEPDFAVVTARSVRAHASETAAWLIEVAVSSIRKDLGLKARLYAAAGVAEYWVVDANTTPSSSTSSHHPMDTARSRRTAASTGSRRGRSRASGSASTSCSKIGERRAGSSGPGGDEPIGSTWTQCRGPDAVTPDGCTLARVVNNLAGP